MWGIQEVSEYKLIRRLILQILMALLSITEATVVIYEAEAAKAAPIEIVEEVKIPTIQDIVWEKFKDTPEMFEIARCESNFRQFEADGSVLTSYYGTNDVGLYQIHVPIWGKEAKRLGHDIYTIEGNLEMAEHILQVQGLQAWDASRKCWQK